MGEERHTRKASVCIGLQERAADKRNCSARNRQIRKMCEAVGLEVARLKRTAIGPIKLGMLQPGKYRELTPQEMKALANARKKAESRKEETR